MGQTVVYHNQSNAFHSCCPYTAVRFRAVESNTVNLLLEDRKVALSEAHSLSQNIISWDSAVVLGNC